MTKIKQVARALWKCRFSHPSFDEALTYPDPPDEVGYYKMHHSNCLNEARVAIEAMIEPTERMLMECRPPRERGPLESYKAMVTVALDESVPPQHRNMW